MPQNRRQQNVMVGQGPALGEQGHVIGNGQHGVAEMGMELVDQRNGLAYCCVPSGCNRYKTNPIIIANPGDAVKVLCNNESCPMGQWMHGNCFAEWEDHVLTQLRSCGRARSWSEKQRLQNLWTKKGYDLVYKVCDCRCKRGHLRKNLDYFPPVTNAKPSKKNRKAKNDKQQTPAVAKAAVAAANNNNHGHAHQMNINANQNNRPQLRVRTTSISSTGSSPPSSAGTPPGSSSSTTKTSKFSLFADTEQAAAGNIFQRRVTLEAFNILPRSDQNPYHIQMEDDGPHGNDDIRCLVLSTLSSKQITVVPCVLCGMQLTVYDKYPLIDGTFFLSSMANTVPIQVERRTLYMHAACLHCCSGHNQVQCYNCRTPWLGKSLLLGSMYKYDIFAARPCCEARLSCKRCNMTILDPSSPTHFYSSYSQPVECPHCRTIDTHFVKNVSQFFTVKKTPL